MPFAFENKVSEQRSEERITVRILATLAWYGETHGILVDNLSNRGALLTGSELPEPDTEVVLSIAGHDLPATVVWCDEADCGLSFHRAIDACLLRDEARRARLPARTHSTLSDWIAMGASHARAQTRQRV